jgi:hypothetical protein
MEHKPILCACFTGTCMHYRQLTLTLNASFQGSIQRVFTAL